MSTARATLPFDCQCPIIRWQVALSYNGTSVDPTSTGHSLQMHVGYNRSPSRYVTRARARRTAAPALGRRLHCATGRVAHGPLQIRFKYMAHEEDWRGFRAAVRIAREIVAQPAFESVIGPEVTPGAHAHTDADIDRYLLDHLEAAYHPCGTCRQVPRRTTPCHPPHHTMTKPHPTVPSSYFGLTVP